MTFQQAPYLRAQRSYPTDDIRMLSLEVDKTYIDIAIKVNNRIIGIFAKNFALATGESWYTEGDNQRRQTLRRLYSFTGTGSIPHGLNYGSIVLLSKPTGSFTDGTNQYVAIGGSNVAIAGQVSFYVTPTNIVILAGAGAPTIVSGIINLEWISQV